MKKLVVMAVLAACGGKEEEAKRGGDDEACTKSIAKIEEIAKVWNADHALAMLSAMKDGEHYRSVWKLCTTKWTDKDRACIAAAADYDALEKCEVGFDEGESNQASASGPAPVDLVEQLRSLADRACACKDKACMSALERDYDAWETEARKQPKPSEAEMTQLGAESDRLEGCASKITVDPCDCKDMTCFDSVFGDLTEAQRADPRVEECRAVLLKYPTVPTGDGELKPAPEPAGPALAVTSLAPGKGAKGQVVELAGSGFTGRSVVVYFGVKKGQVQRVDGDARMVVAVPDGTAGETVDVLVIFEPGGEIELPKAFTYE